MIVEDKDLSDVVSVGIDVKFSDDELQDVFFINQTTRGDNFIINLGVSLMVYKRQRYLYCVE